MPNKNLDFFTTEELVAIAHDLENTLAIELVHRYEILLEELQTQVEEMCNEK